MKKEQTRREFLKYSGTIVLLVGSGCYVPVNGKLADPKAPDAPVKISPAIPASDDYLIVDIKKCQGCVSCMLACSLVHEGVESQSLSRIQIIQNSFETFPDDLTIEQCRQCVEPACVEASSRVHRAGPKYRASGYSRIPSAGLHGATLAVAFQLCSSLPAGTG